MSVAVGNRRPGRPTRRPVPLLRRPPGPAPGTTTSPTVERLKAIAGVIAPGTVVAALMYYFGYVTSYARFAYFGVDLSTLHMSVQDLAMQSVAALYVPAAALLALALLGHLLHRGTQELLGSGRFRRTLGWAGRVVVLLGAVLLVRAVAGVLDTGLAATEPIGSTPAALGAGPLAVAWGRHLTVAASGRGAAAGPGRVRLGWLLVTGIGVLSLFWVTNSVAGAYGTGQARQVAARLDQRPAVSLDTAERLYLVAPGVEELALPEAAEQKMHYRYAGLRLLVESDKTLFLIPARWREGGPVVVVERDDDVRMTFTR